MLSIKSTFLNAQCLKLLLKYFYDELMNLFESTSFSQYSIWRCFFHSTIFKLIIMFCVLPQDL